MTPEDCKKRAGNMIADGFMWCPQCGTEQVSMGHRTCRACDKSLPMSREEFQALHDKNMKTSAENDARRAAEASFNRALRNSSGSPAEEINRTDAEPEGTVEVTGDEVTGDEDATVEVDASEEETQPERKPVPKTRRTR